MRCITIVKRSWKSVLFCVIFVFLYELIIHLNSMCTTDDAVGQIEHMCAQYHNREIVGDMCSILCDQSAFKFLRCHGKKVNKKVIVMTCDGCIEPEKTSTVVLKIRYDMKTWQNSIGTSIKTLNSIDEKVYRSTKEIQSKLMESYGTVLPQHNDLISLMLGENFNDLVTTLNSSNAIDVVLRTALGLGSQEEFISHKVLGLTSFLPKLFGICGPGYFVENTPSYNTLNYAYFSWRPSFTLWLVKAPSWEDRVKAALSSLRMVAQFEDNYNTPLQFCDIAAINIGLSESKEAVMLDSDSLTFGQKVVQGTCNIDDDCRFFSCQGYCDQTTKLCTKEITVNNLQLLCRRILVTEHETLGLLRSPPLRIKERLRKLLYQCMYPVPGVFKVPTENKSDRELLRDIEILLTSTL